jgi:prepilin-type N-terminal cleavage/methylation domain-containing protein
MPNQMIERSRAGFTLLELVLVLAILAAALSVAVPTYDSMIVERRLQESAEAIELKMQGSRVEAMRTGQAQVFRFEIGGSQYVSDAWLSQEDSLNAAAGATQMDFSGQRVEVSSSNPYASTLAPTSGTTIQLPEGVTVASAQSVRDSRAALAEQEAGMAGGATTSWSTPILFYADGTSTTAIIVLQDSRGRRRSIQLRGLTGQCRIVDLASVGTGEP